MPDPFAALLEQSAALHKHLCPRQVLGVRMGLLGGASLGLSVPQAFESKRLITIVETDGCFADGISVAANCWIGRRTLRVEDYGKVAATFIDTFTGHAVRVHPQPDARDRARALAPDAPNRWQAQLLGYQRLAEAELFVTTPVTLTLSLAKLVSRAGYRVNCECCGEEILNEREVNVAGRLLCRSCAGAAYYDLAPAELPTARNACHDLATR
ncbi:MAG: TraR/DksA C4-type zinc finger protein [Anaerolineales bacterium]|nr:TraR/DksA C4-type zinc finger protein [Anaerolineales bacterium]